MPRVLLSALASWSLALAGLTGGGVGARTGQEPLARPDAAQPPVFRTGTTLVEVDAIVRDRAGRFVADLGASEFIVAEDGKPQQIDFVYVVTGTSVTSVNGGLAGDRARGSAPVPAPRVNQIFLLVFDTAHVHAGAGGRARAAAERFLAQDFRPGDIGGVVAGGRMTNNRLTSDRQELLRAVRGVGADLDAHGRRGRDAAGASLAASADEGLAAAAAEHLVGIEQAERTEISREEARRAAENTLNTLEQIVRGLSRLPGRKNVVLFSNGFKLTGVLPGERPGNVFAQLRRVIERAQRSSVRIYTIDTRGLGWRIDTDAIVRVEPAPSPHADGMMEPEEDDFLTSLAMDTGGIPIRDRNDFGQALDVVADDSTSYYVLGYRSTNTGRGNRFRAIDVRVSRPDVQVRARRGYFPASPHLETPK